ncbi:MAG: hypothetical protein AB7N80_12945, partial [Bdellovibrionales bacterium]
QLLQSKIAVLEDLSDRTDAQVKQLTSLIEQKARLLQNKIIEAEHQIRRVDQAMHKSKEVAEIFQDKIPHQEIIERQNTIKYVKAAKLAHAGKSLQEIAAAVDLPMVQLELIAKLNKDQLVFDAEALPEWAQNQIVADDAANFTAEVLAVPSAAPASSGGDLATLFEPPKEEYASLKRLGEEFRNACVEFDRQHEGSEATMTEAPFTEAANMPSTAEDPSAIYEGAKKVTAKIVASAGEFLQQVEAKAKDFIEPSAAKPVVKVNPPSLTTPPLSPKPAPIRTGTVEVRKVEFPRVNINQNLR